MRSGRSRPSLGERAAGSGIAGGGEGPDRPVRPPDGTPARGRSGAGRHCWVTDPPEWPGTWPGLLVEWRKGESGWEGRVVYAVPANGRDVLVEAWLPTPYLKAASG